jgi:hypothetical protein
VNVQDRKLYSATIWSLSLFLLAAGSVLVIAMLANVIGPFRFTALDASSRSRAVGFWIPADGDLPYPPEIKRRAAAWRRFVGDDDIVIESNRLRDLLNAGVGVVILPDARRIDAEHADALHRYMMEGGGVIVTGSIGVRDADDEWLGYGLMRDLLQVASIAPLPREQSDSLSAGWRGPIAARLDPGARFGVISEPGVAALAGSEGELLWGKAVEESGSHAGASRRIRLGLGRLVWIGPGPEVIDESDLADRSALEGALANAIAWVRRKPVLEVMPWSNGARYAVELGKRVDPEAGPLDDRARFAFEDQAMATIARAARTGEHVVIEIPISGPGDAWAEALRIRLLERIGADGGWPVSRDQASSWLAARAGLSVSVTQAGPNRILVNVSNRSDIAVTGVGLRLWINRPASSIQTGAINVGQVVPGVVFHRASESAEISMPDLAAGSTVAFYIDLDDPDFDEVAAVQSR